MTPEPIPWRVRRRLWLQNYRLFTAAGIEPPLSRRTRQFLGRSRTIEYRTIKTGSRIDRPRTSADATPGTSPHHRIFRKRKLSVSERYAKRAAKDESKEGSEASDPDDGAGRTV